MIWPFALSSTVFVGAHFALSAHPIRSALIARLGDGGFRGLYSVATGVPFVALFFTWGMADVDVLWAAPPWTRWIPIVLMPIALVFIVAAVPAKNPTAFLHANAVDVTPQGIVSITRHPMLLGFLLWALAHLPANGDVRSVVLFGSFAVLSFGGMLHIDARRRRAFGEGWDHFAAQTSIVPFAAIISGRARLDTRGLPLAVVIALALTAVIVLSHEYLIGAPALPG